MFLENPEADWPESPQALLARRILPEYLRHGPAHFVANADVVMRIWRAGSQVLPVVYLESGRARTTAEVCSPWSHYVRYPIEEMKRHRTSAEAMLGRGLVRVGAVLLRASRIEEVVSVNNWLLSTNPPPRLEPAEIERLTAGLCETFPERAIVIRTINPAIDGQLGSSYVRRGYRLVASRTVYLLDPSSHRYQQSQNVRADRCLLRRGDYERLGHEQLTAADMPRLAELHRMLYIEKHSVLNAELRPSFFEAAWRNRLFEFQALRKDGRIDAYAAWYELDGLLTSSVVGYDTRLPTDLGLYRRCMALLTEQARERGLRLHLSAGAGAFKHHRGAEPCVEYDAVFDRHLPRSRRAGWRLLEAAGYLQHRKVSRGW